MTATAQHRAQLLTQLLAGQLTLAEAAHLLARSERQVRRLAAAYASAGPAALVHGNHGRQPAHTLSADLRQEILRLAQERYAGFNTQHLTEKLQEEHQLAVSRASVRRILAAAGLRPPRTRRPAPHRSRRERLPQAGMLLQADGSRHRWLGPERPFLTLIGGIDDATGTIPYALFREQEDAHGYFLWLRAVLQQEGLPLALYVDRHGIFRVNPTTTPSLSEQLAGERQPTQFGRALAELDITLIHAQSPQAKGRIERVWGTLQDRLVSELRLAGATTLAAANQVLWDFLPQFNRRFAVPAAQAGSAYRALPPTLDVETVCCFKYTRVVAADNTLQFGERRLQLLPSQARTSYAKARVEVQERLDGSLAVYYQGRCVASQPAPAEAPVLRARKRTAAQAAAATEPKARAPAAACAAPPAAGPAAPTRTAKPGPNHVWRQPFTRKQQLRAATAGTAARAPSEP